MNSNLNTLITDLDNTLYDWVGFYSKAFTAMLDRLVVLLQVSREQLVMDFREVHRRSGSSEQPFAVLDLPSVKARFPQRTRQELVVELDDVLHAFNASRKDNLHLYPGVEEALKYLRARDVAIIAVTDAAMVNAYYRLWVLGIAPLFTRIYVRDTTWQGHPNATRDEKLRPPAAVVRALPSSLTKPDPRLLATVLELENVQPDQACYVGDSIARDVLMAVRAGVKSAWARYGAEHDASAWAAIVEITHWTREDVRREEELAKEAQAVTPDFVLESFADILAVFKREVAR